MRSTSPAWIGGLGLLLGAAISCAPPPPSDDDEGSDADPTSQASPMCGDGICSVGESCESCEGDCGACSSSCYDGICGLSESCTNCPADCGPGCPMLSPFGDGDGDGDGPDPLDPGGDWPEDWASLEDDIVRRVNEVRQAGVTCPSGFRQAVPPVAVDDTLVEAARTHALDMGTRSYFEHDNPEGIDPFERMEAAGFSGQPRAENIARGYPDAETAFSGWLSSDGHCVNMMLDDLTHIGVGYAHVEADSFAHYWVQNFGRR